MTFFQTPLIFSALGLILEIMRDSLRLSLVKSLAELSVNLASGWLGVLLISPGFLGISTAEYLKLLTVNLPPAILSFIVGWLLTERSAKL